MKELIEDFLGLDDLFKKTRQREYIEARSLHDYILYHYKEYKYDQIAAMRGKKHANAWHSVNRFEVHRKYNRRLNLFISLYEYKFKK